MRSSSGLCDSDHRHRETDRYIDRHTDRLTVRQTSSPVSAMFPPTDTHTHTSIHSVRLRCCMKSHYRTLYKFTTDIDTDMHTCPHITTAVCMPSTQMSSLKWTSTPVLLSSPRYKTCYANWSRHGQLSHIWQQSNSSVWKWRLIPHNTTQSRCENFTTITKYSKINQIITAGKKLYHTWFRVMDTY